MNVSPWSSGGPYRTRTCDPLRVMHVWPVHDRPPEVVQALLPGRSVHTDSRPFAQVWSRCLHRCLHFYLIREPPWPGGTTTDHPSGVFEIDSTRDQI